jgi:hypothetical protein
LKATGWFQTLTLAHQSWFQSVPFKFNLRRYSEVEGLTDDEAGLYELTHSLTESAL